MAVTQLYKSYGLDANTFVEVQVDPPESPNGDVKNGSDSTDVQTFVPTDRVQNLTKDVFPLDITHHNSPVQTSTLATREDPKSSQTSKKSATPDLTDVQNFIPTDCVLNLTEDVLPLDITHHNSPVQTKTPARKHPKSSQTSKKSATPATPFALRRPKRSRKPRYIYSPSKY